MIAELLIDCAACRRSVGGDDEPAQVQALHQSIRQREHACVQALLRLYAFRQDDASLVLIDRALVSILGGTDRQVA